MGIMGAFIGGMLIDLVGISSCYYLAAAMRGVALVVFWMIRIKAKTPVKGEKRNVFRDLVEGLRYIRGSRSLVGLLAMAAYWNLFISMQGFRATLLPIFARDVLGVGASGYGMLSAAASLGTFVGSLLIAVLSNYKHKGWLLLIGAELIGIALILFSLLPHFYFSLFLWACVGIMSSIYSNTSQTLLLTTSSDEMRGRVMGARSQVISVLPINAIWVGVAAQSFGAPLTMILGGSLWGVAVLVTALLVPKLRKIE
jgi:predicted MFS family arabinose efflux permease